MRHVVPLQRGEQRKLDLRLLCDVGERHLLLFPTRSKSSAEARIHEDTRGRSVPCRAS